MAKKRFVIKMGSFEPKRGGKKQPGLDLSRTIEDTLVDDGLATRTSDCCFLFSSFPDIVELGLTSSDVPLNSLYRNGDELRFKASNGDLYIIDMTLE